MHCMYLAILWPPCREAVTGLVGSEFIQTEISTSPSLILLATTFGPVPGADIEDWTFMMKNGRKILEQFFSILSPCDFDLKMFTTN